MFPVRYLTDIDGLDVDQAVKAEMLFERFLGYQMAPTKFSETVEYDPKRGAFLTHTPVIRLVNVLGRSFDAPGVIAQLKWNVINLNDVVLHQKTDRALVVVPTNMFGMDYDELQIEYVSGYPIGPDVKQAVLDIYDELIQGKIDEWNVYLPSSVMDVIDVYRREVTY